MGNSKILEATIKEYEINKEDITEIQKTIDRGIEFWKYVSQFAYAHQYTLIKNYLWLSVTIITACVAIYSRFILNNNDFIQEKYLFVAPFIYSCLMLCTLSSLISFFIGVFNLSSIGHKNIISGPFKVDSCETMVRRLVIQGCLSNLYKDSLISWAAWYDASYESFIEMINKRGLILRCQCWLIMASIALGTLSICLFLIFK